MTILLMSAKWSLFLMMPTDALVDEYVNTHSRTRINKTLGEIPKNRIMSYPSYYSFYLRFEYLFLPLS